MWYLTYQLWRGAAIGAAVGATVLLSAPRAHGKSGGDALQGAGCGGCHALAPPAAEARTLAAYASRKGPDLFYAGSKYRPEWLRAWLLRPTPIRPAGLHPAERTRATEGGDAIADAVDTAPHPAVPAAQVDAVVAGLQRLDWGKERLAAAPPVSASVPRTLAELNFVKFKGCGSCHRTAPGSAAVSGPDLGDAYVRLRPEFLASYIADPQAWDPVAPMPNYALPPPEVGKLVAYLRILSEDDHDAK